MSPSIEREPFSILPDEPPDRFARLEALLKKTYYEPDAQAIRIVLGTVKSHYLNIGDPAWLFIVAPPGSGKTTAGLLGVSSLPEVVSLGDLTENTFLSGFYGHRQAGLLEKLGRTTDEGGASVTQANAILLAKDFTTVLTMRRERRAAILGQLREIHDGQFKRDFGTGETKIWRGRVTFIAAVTPVIDRHYAAFSTLGERFLQVRWHRPDSEVAGEWAIRQQGHEQAFQEEAKSIIRELVEPTSTEAPSLSPDMCTRIASLAEVVALARTHVFRNGYGNREIEYVPEAEANTRLSKGLAAIARGIAAINHHPRVSEQDLQDSLRVGIDCISDVRRRALSAIADGEDPEMLPIPDTTMERSLEELQALQVLNRSENKWELTPRIAALWGVANPRLQ